MLTVEERKGGRFSTLTAAELLVKGRSSLLQYPVVHMSDRRGMVTVPSQL